MQWNSLFWTVLVATILTSAGLKILEEMQFIKWSPIGWTDTFQIATGSHNSIKWTLLFAFLFAGFLVYYLLVMYTTALPESLTALLSTIMIVGVIVYLIHRPGNFQEMVDAFSIPFFSLIAIICRFVVGTAVFMKKTFN